MTGARILVEALIEQGVENVFGYPGGRVVDIYDELSKASDKIRHILTSHEQGAAHAADGFARATGKTGVVLATSGPGATNLVTGIATAMLDSIPMVAITGNVPTSLIGKDAFQEVNITGVTMPITKHNYFVTDVNELAETVREAFKLAHSGRPGPVLIDIPQDVQKAECDFEPLAEIEKPKRKAAKQIYIDSAVKLINKAKRPYIYIGGGAADRDMSEDILAFAEKIDAFIGCSLMGLSLIPHSCARFLGMEGMHGKFASTKACSDADLIIAVGARFSDRATGDPELFARDTVIIHLDTDLAEINKNVSADVGIIGDIVDALSRISSSVKAKKHPEWAKHIEKLKLEEQEEDKTSGEELNPKSVFEIINRLKSDTDVVATDVGQHQMWAAQYLSFQKPRRFLTSGGLGTMGYGFGAAIGASVGTGERSILITGDGSFGMNLNELATAVTYNIPIVIVIFNNGVLGLVRQWQKSDFESRFYETALHRKTDFVKLAEAFGAKGGRAETAEEFEKLFKEALEQKGPFVIDAKIDENEFVTTLR